jgi:translation initiation factor 5B
MGKRDKRGNYLDMLYGNLSAAEATKEEKKETKKKNENEGKEESNKTAVLEIEKETQATTKKEPPPSMPKETQPVVTRPEFGRRKGPPDIALIKKLQEERQRREEEARIEKEAEEARRKKREEMREQERLAEEKAAIAAKEQAKQKAHEKELIRRMGRIGVKDKAEKKTEKKEWVSTVDKNLKSPICCILGHVDTGKTKILDKLRETQVQESEAGGITQQIGATYFPIESLHAKYGVTSKLPGMLIIDTPGHESFSNLRSRGSSLCNLAILVVDIFHLLEPQTLESIELLKQRKTPFVVALNKIDRIYEWEKSTGSDVAAGQKDFVKREFRRMVDEVILKFAEIGFNARLYNENPDVKKFLSLVPTSAITGEGLGNLVGLLLKASEEFMKKRNTYTGNFECVLLEVKVVEGFGSTVDAILVDGNIEEGDKVCVCSFDGPVITKVKSILLPQPLKEMRVKSPYTAVKSAKASLGLKIAALGLEKAIAGSRIQKVMEGKEEEAKKAALDEIDAVFSSIKTKPLGVHVQAPTLGSLEALTAFLEKEEVPVSSFSIGNVRKADIVKTSSMKQYALMLCFDVFVDKELMALADTMGVKVLNAKIIYHLVDQYRQHMKKMSEANKAKHADVVFPCALEIVPACIFTKRSPLVLGVEVKEGKLKVGTPLFVRADEKIERLGKVTSIENNKKSVDVATKGQKVAIKIEVEGNEPSKIYGKHFTEKDTLYSVISRHTIDMLKQYFRDEVDNDDLRLIVELKKILNIV